MSSKGVFLVKYLYCRKQTPVLYETNNQQRQECKVFRPRVFGGLFLAGEPKSIKVRLVRVLFQVATLGKARIYFVTNGDDFVHTSYVVPKCKKFSFLKANDYEIGPCFTYPKYRGQGVYPAVLKEICSSIGDKSTCFYIIVDETNISSIKGIEKAGFVRCGTVRVSKFTKRYVLEKT